MSATIGAIIILAAVAYIAAEIALRRLAFSASARNSDLATILFYSSSIHRVPGELISFRLYGPKATPMIQSDVRLNNMGFFSKYDYSYERGPNEFRIVVIGGEQTASSVANFSWPDVLQHELNLRDSSKRYKVFNIAWPDAGPEHYVQYWKEHGTKFDPDLVIVNFVENDFFRTISGTPLTYKGQPIGHSTIEYRVGPGDDDVARTTTANIRGRPVTSYRDLSAIPPRPYGFFASREFISDTAKVGALQNMVVRDMISGTLPPMGMMVWDTIRDRRIVSEAWRARDYDLMPTAAPDMQRMVDYGISTFGWLVQNIPNLILSHNFNRSERHAEFKLTDAMMAKAPYIKVTDMRERIRPNLSDEEFARWYHWPSMAEKWSDTGHSAFGHMMAELVVDWRKGWRP